MAEVSHGGVKCESIGCVHILFVMRLVYEVFPALFRRLRQPCLENLPFFVYTVVFFSIDRG